MTCPKCASENSEQITTVIIKKMFKEVTAALYQCNDCKRVYV